MDGGDGGLQRERTRLAWRRTCLAVVLGGAVALRLLPPVLGSAGVLVACLVLIGGAALTVLAEARGRTVQRTALDGEAVLPAAGALALMLSGAVTLASVLAAVAVLWVRATS